MERGEPGPARGFRPVPAILAVILLLAAVPRLVALDRSPPGASVDEVSNVWNAYCLLETGADQHGRRWPVLYMRAYGETRSALFLYVLAPVQAIGGPTIAASRAAGALCGLLTVLLAFYVGSRLFDRTVGLTAAALLAVNPTHVYYSRSALETTLTPLLSLLPVALLLWAGFGLGAGARAGPRAGRAALAGALCAVCLYGHWAVRLYVPVLLLGLVPAAWAVWRATLREPRGRAALAALVLGGAIVASPLAWAHLTDPEIAARGSAVGWLWTATDSAAAAAGKVLLRYLGHFGPSFLFGASDGGFYWLSGPAGWGRFHLYEAALLLAGVVALVPRLRGAVAARVLLVALLVYPAGDLLFGPAGQPHALRSLPGIVPLVLLAAFGAVALLRRVRQRHRALAAGLAVAVALWAGVTGVRWASYALDGFNREPGKRFHGHVAFLEACEWLRPRLDGYDAVFLTGAGVPHPYMYALAGLRYDPARYLADDKELVAGPLPDGRYRDSDVVFRVGKLHFMLDDRWRAEVERLKASPARERVAVVVRQPQPGLPEPALEIRGPDGDLQLLVFDTAL